ncbi:hypothetical protein ACQ143_04720 [Microbacterium sp. MC2]
MSIVYPRLSRSDVASEIDRLERTMRSGGVAQAFPDGGHHPGAIFPAVGVPVAVARLRELHAIAFDSVRALDARRRADRDRLFDITVGNVLASWFEDDGRSQAAHPDIWPYITLVVLPDLAVQRFGPDASGKLPHDRFAAGRRNVFQRLYLRSWILGDLLSDPELPLFEDELVGLVDRNLSSDHRLARMVSEQIRNLDRTQNRREPVRNAFKTLQFELRVTDVSSLNDDALRSLLSSMFQPAT